MKWVYVDFEPYAIGDRDLVGPHALHPLMARARIQDILDRYPVRVRHIKRMRDQYLDLGGMAFIGEEWVEVLLSSDRRVYVRNSQLSTLVDVLRTRKFGPEARCPEGYTRYFRYPGVLTYLSRADVQKMLKKLAPLCDPAAEYAHRMSLREVLIQSQAKGDKDIEATLRRVMGVPAPISV